ncbi:MAG: LysM peptidoglycan-binding domain-containing protein [Oscillospiraceae bacterium]
MIHTVLPGETLRGIAAMHGTGPDLLAAWNGTAEPLTGQELLVLHPQALHTARCGESWQSLSARFGLPELRRCNPGPLRPGRRLVLGFRERGTRPLALCGTMGPEWNDLGLSYTCELAADAAELDGDGALHRLPLHGRPACLRLTGSGAKLETLLRSRAAQERLLLETAALCRACGTAQVELTVRDLLPDCDPAPLVSRLQALLAERGGGLTLALPGPARSAGRPRCWLGWLPLPGGARSARSSGAAAGKITGGL